MSTLASPLNGENKSGLIHTINTQTESLENLTDNLTLYSPNSMRNHQNYKKVQAYSSFRSSQIESTMESIKADPNITSTQLLLIDAIKKSSQDNRLLLELMGEIKKENEFLRDAMMSGILSPNRSMNVTQRNHPTDQSNLNPKSEVLNSSTLKSPILKKQLDEPADKKPAAEQYFEELDKKNKKVWNIPQVGGHLLDLSHRNVRRGNVVDNPLVRYTLLSAQLKKTNPNNAKTLFQRNTKTKPKQPTRIISPDQPENFEGAADNKSQYGYNQQQSRLSSKISNYLYTYYRSSRCLW